MNVNNYREIVHAYDSSDKTNKRLLLERAKDVSNIYPDYPSFLDDSPWEQETK